MKNPFPLLLLIVCSSYSLWGQPTSLVAVSATSKGTMQKGYGMIVTLTNIETNQSFESKSMGPISKHSVIYELPPGKYAVTKVKVPVGDLVYINWAPDLRDFFGIIHVNEGKNYYLGNFFGNRKIGRKNVLHLRIEDENIPEKLIKKLKKKGYNLDVSDFIKTYPYALTELLVF